MPVKRRRAGVPDVVFGNWFAVVIDGDGPIGVRRSLKRTVGSDFATVDQHIPVCIHGLEFEPGFKNVAEFGGKSMADVSVGDDNIESQGSGFRVQGLKSRIQGLGFRIWS